MKKQPLASLPPTMRKTAQQLSEEAHLPAEELPRDLRVSVSVSRKINLGNYESLDIFFSVSGIEPGTPQAEIAEALETGETAWQVVKNKVREKIVEVRRERGLG